GGDRSRWSEADWATREWVIETSYAVNGIPEGVGRYSFESSGPLTHLVLAGGTLLIENAGTDPRLSPAMQRHMLDLDIGALVLVAVMADGRVRANLSIQQRAPRRWTQEEIALIEGVAGRCWAEVDRARAESALRESEENYRTLFESMDEAYALC